jgi:phosphohistidine phosphatase
VPVPLVLDLIRHGEAEPEGRLGDRARLLTAAGESALQRLGFRIVTSGSRPDVVLSSPLERAIQSARIVARTQSPEVPTDVMEALDPHFRADGVLKELIERGLTGHAVLVGHLPQLDDLHLLLTGQSAAFPVATLRRIVFVNGAGVGNGRSVLTLKP